MLREQDLKTNSKKSLEENYFHTINRSEIKWFRRENNLNNFKLF